MVVSNINGIIFTLRSGALAIQNGLVMLNKGIKDNYWFIPGGRIEEGEDSVKAINREMKEEINQAIKINKLQCVIENFFVENDKKYHEVGIYYDINVPKPWEGPMYIRDGNSEIEYRWIKLEDIKKEVIYPEAIKNVILGINKNSHIIYRNYYKEKVPNNRFNLTQCPVMIPAEYCCRNHARAFRRLSVCSMDAFGALKNSKLTSNANSCIMYAGGQYAFTASTRFSRGYI